MSRSNPNAPSLREEVVNGAKILIKQGAVALNEKGESPYCYQEITPSYCSDGQVQKLYSHHLGVPEHVETVLETAGVSLAARACLRVFNVMPGERLALDRSKRGDKLHPARGGHAIFQTHLTSMMEGSGSLTLAEAKDILTGLSQRLPDQYKLTPTHLGARMKGVMAEQRLRNYLLAAKERVVVASMGNFVITHAVAASGYEDVFQGIDGYFDINTLDDDQIHELRYDGKSSTIAALIARQKFKTSDVLRLEVQSLEPITPESRMASPVVKREDIENLLNRQIARQIFPPSSRRSQRRSARRRAA